MPLRSIAEAETLYRRPAHNQMRQAHWMPRQNQIAVEVGVENNWGVNREQYVGPISQQ